MIRETMTGIERMEAAVRFEKTDRTPLVVGVQSAFVGKYAGLTPAESYRSFDKLVQADKDIWNEFGGWDIRYGDIGLHDKDDQYPFGPMYWGIPRVMPGEELPDYADVQNREVEIMHEDDYDKLLSMGWYDFWYMLASRVHPGITKDILGVTFLQPKRQQAKKYWDSLGIPSVYPSGVMDPVNMLATWRSSVNFLMDIHTNYKKVRAAVHDVLLPVFLDKYRENVRKCGDRFVLVCAALYQMPFVSPEVFQDLEGDWIDGCVNILLEEGRIPIYHLDSNWDEAISYFLKFPEHSGIIHLGGETNIFKAKEVLKGHTCLMGDASPVMMQVCSPEEITAYYKKLVDVVGADNGYIINEGCYLSAHSRFENVRAMVDVAKNYMTR
jgi:hypothetical protein